eukprot:486414_1
METKEEQLTSLSDDDKDGLDDEKGNELQANEINITELYNKLQRFGYYSASTKYIDLREIQQFNKYHIATCVNVTVKSDNICSFDDLLVIDTIQTCKLKKQLSSDTVIIFIGNNNCNVIQSFLFNQIGIKQFMILETNGFDKFMSKYPWMIVNGQGYKYKNEMLCDYPHEIIENKLFLGNYAQSDNIEIISNLQITHIIN